MSESLVVKIFNNEKTSELIEDMEQYDVNEQFGKSGVTPLIAAVRKDDLELVEELIEEGADCNLTDNDGNTPLIVACLFANEIEIIKLLLNHNANPNIKNKKKLVALQAALLDANRINPVTKKLVSGRDEVIKELLLFNAQIKEINNFKIVEQISHIAKIAGIGIGERTTNILSSNGTLKFQ